MVNKRLRRYGVIRFTHDAGTVTFVFVQLASREALSVLALWRIKRPQLTTNLNPTWRQLALP
ncbi:hypothetical protein [Xenorhabdus sp. SGI246]|uniref:hypothetical protein n=1 Tax=Xenorhabdus sp. SGI246 TaxID=3158263 RepID=UPI00349FB470